MDDDYGGMTPIVTPRVHHPLGKRNDEPKTMAQVLTFNK